MHMDDEIGGAAFAAIVRGSLDAIIVSDDNGCVIEFNPAAERIFGWTRAEALSRSISEMIIPPHLRAQHEAGMARMRAGAAPRLTERRVELEALRRNGEIFDCEFSVARLESAGRTLFAACLRDLSEQVRERKARQEAEDLLRAIFEDQTEIIFRYDADLRVTSCNGAAARLYGLDRKALLGRHLFDDVEEAAQPRLAAAFAELKPEAPVRHATDPKRLPDGRVRWIDWTDRALFDEVGTLVGYQSVGRDVTQRMLEQQALVASEARLAAFLENAPIGMYIKDGEGRFIVANTEMGKVFGQPEGDILGKTAHELAPRDLLPIIDAADAQVRQTGQPSATEEYMPGAAAYEWTLVVRFPIRQGPGTPVHIGGFDIDISSVKAAEAELARARDALHQSEKMTVLGGFAAGLAHELNNPLTVLAGQAEMLVEDIDDGPAAHRAVRIMRAANRCARIARSFLSIAQRKVPHRAPTDLNAVVLAALELAAFVFRGSDVEVVTALSTPPPMPFADADQLHQVVLNLLLNAEQAMRDAPEKIITVTTDVDEDAGTVRLRVADTGPGLAPDIRERIFDPFFTTKASTGGVGIGLFHCRQVARDHGGEVDLIATDAGACFQLVLPVHASVEPQQDVSTVPAQRLALQVLVIDNDPDVAAAVCDMLNAEGCNATVAPGEDNGVDSVEADGFDLVLKDLTPSDLDGLDPSSDLRKLRPVGATHVVFMTAAPLNAEFERAFAFAGSSLLQKPFARGDLRRVLDRVVLDRNRARP